MTNEIPVPHAKVLHSWKEIAVYTGRGVRTIQRYESKLGFPIRRPAGVWRSAVLAFSNEIDEWLAKSPTKPDSVMPQAEFRHISTVRASSNHHLMIDDLFRKARTQSERAAVMKQRMVETQKLVVRMHAFMEQRTAISRKVAKTVATADHQPS